MQVIRDSAMQKNADCAFNGDPKLAQEAGPELTFNGEPKLGMDG